MIIVRDVESIIVDGATLEMCQGLRIMRMSRRQRILLALEPRQLITKAIPLPPKLRFRDIQFPGLLFQSTQLSIQLALLQLQLLQRSNSRLFLFPRSLKRIRSLLSLFLTRNICIRVTQEIDIGISFPCCSR